MNQAENFLKTVVPEEARKKIATDFADSDLSAVTWGDVYFSRLQQIVNSDPVLEFVAEKFQELNEKSNE